MFDDGRKARVYGLPPGADFAAELAEGILARMDGSPVEALARVTVLVNTRRMQRRLKALLSDGSPRLLPRIGLVTDLDNLLPAADRPPPVSALRRRLELARLVGALIESEPGIATPAAKVDLADSLASLMDEMQGEGVAPDVLETLDVSDQSGHWAQSLRFLSIVHQYTDATAGQWMDPEARRRLSALQLLAAWQEAPPSDPIIVAGSTGSRATTSLLMQAVAALPQGAVVLPGFDFDLPEDVWQTLTDTRTTPLGAEDHPQYRFAAFLEKVGLGKDDIEIWGRPAGRQERNELISLSLRPAPVTDQWLQLGPDLGDLMPRTRDMALLEAPDQKTEALAIAVALRQAVEDGKTAALITPDRTLGRRVAAALQRWDIVPDDSAGRPLSLTAPGRFLRQVAGLIGSEVDPVALVALLKHPLANSGADRGPHLRMTREFELYLRRKKVAVITNSVIEGFRAKRAEGEQAWCLWIAGWLDRIATLPAPRLADGLAFHIEASEALSAGEQDGSGDLWEKATGRDVLKLIAGFHAEASFTDPLPFAEYVQLIERALSSENTRTRDAAREDVMIWGTLEARVQGADLVVLGGLNEGVWPERPASDPWLNRPLRRQAGLLLPERQIGLAAHDYQQAIAAKEVILSRASRDADSETVASRWLSRLTNLLAGLKDQNGPEALAAMKGRGRVYLDIAHRLDQPAAAVPPQPRPAPAPPASQRPRDLTVTDIEKLIRDPYAIYAKYVLGLRALDPLRVTADARLKGEVFHKIVEDAFGPDVDLSDTDQAVRHFCQTADRHFAALAWPMVRAQWTGHIQSIAWRLVVEEQVRRTKGKPIAQERKGRIDVPGTGFSIRGKADRIDRLTDGRLAIFDYKTGSVPSVDQIRYFDRQLPIEAVMAELGGFEDLLETQVVYVTHIGLGRTPSTRETPLVQTDKLDFRTETIKGELAVLLSSFDSDSKGYPSRRAMEKLRYDGDYDHLARYGEWDATEAPVTERLP